MKKYYVFGLLIIAALFILLAACGRADDTPAPVAPAVATPAPAPGAATPAPAAETPPADLGPPREIIFGGPWQHGPMTGSEPDPDSIWYAVDSIRIPFLHDVTMPTFNVEWVHIYIPFGEGFIPAIAASVLAGEPLADMLLIQPFVVVNAYLQGLIQPLETFVPPDNPIWNDRLVDRRGVTPEAHFAGRTLSFLNSSYDLASIGMMVNMDMVERLGLQCPVELYETGQWDWDWFRRLMAEATFSSTGAAIDHVGLRGGTWDLYRAIIPANSGTFIDPTNGRITLDSPQTMMSLQFVYDFITQDQSWAALHEEIPAENVLFQISQWGGLRDRDFAVDWIPFPMGPMNTTGWTSTHQPRNSFTILTGTDAAFVFEVYDFHESGWVDGDYSMQRWLSYIQLEEVMPNQAAVERVIRNALPPNRTIDLATYIHAPFFTYMLDPFTDGFMDRTLTPASAVESFVPPLQAAIDSVWGEFFGR